MRTVGKLALALLTVLSVWGADTQVFAQSPGLDLGKDCQTIRTCNFGRRGTYRGCLSTYACRRCKYVPAPCTVDGTHKICNRLRCTWG